MYIYLNDRLVPASEAVVSVYDHGFLYGDGIYETMRVYDGVVFKLDEHLLRLGRSASLIGLSLPKSADGLKLAVYETLSANALRNAYLRLTVSRGRGPVGLDPELCKEPTLVVMAEEFKEYPRRFYELGVGLVTAQTRRNLREAVDPRIKSLNFLNNILAKMEAKGGGAYEALMLNASGHLAECTVSNVFFLFEEILHTPSVECGILDGITREIVLGLALREGLRVREGEFDKEAVYRASEVFITNTTLEVMPVSRVDDRRYEVGDVSRLLKKAYAEEVRAYTANVKGGGPSVWGYSE